MKSIAFLFLLSFSLFGYTEGEFYKLHPFEGHRLSVQDVREDGSAQVFLYNGKGVWDTGYEHLKMFLSEHGISYKTVYAEDLKNGLLEKQAPKTLIMPGGESWQYLDELGETGASQIKSYVAKGGGYIGICAGAFYATSNRMGGKTTGPYGIGLLEGTAYDGTALNTAPFIEGMMDIPTVQDSILGGFLSNYKIVLFGGPSFRFSKEEAEKKKIEVLSKFQQIDEPAMILFQYGKGNVYLSGPHLEIEEDRTSWGPSFNDPETDWPILDRVLKRTSKLD